MALQRITHLTAPPVVGRWYLVPTVTYQWLDDELLRPWPVFLPKHQDGEHFNFHWPHYHVDPRFLVGPLWRRAMTAGRRYEDDVRSDATAYQFCQSAPLMRLRNPGIMYSQEHRRGPGDEKPHGPVVWRRMRCARPGAPYQHADKPPVRALNDDFSGRQCKRARGGWVCPHRNFPLGSVAADAEGVITCPLHGLRISAETGLVVGSAHA